MLDPSVVLWTAFLHLERTQNLKRVNSARHRGAYTYDSPVSDRLAVLVEVQKTHCFRERILRGLPEIVVLEDIRWAVTLPFGIHGRLQCGPRCRKRDERVKAGIHDHFWEDALSKPTIRGYNGYLVDYLMGFARTTRDFVLV